MIFVKLPNIKGDSTIPGHIGEIEVDSYKFGSVGLSDGMDRGPRSNADLVLIKQRDSSTSILMEYLAKGTSISNGEMLVVSRLPGSRAKQQILYKMKDLFIVGLIPKTVFDVGGPRYYEEVLINFKGISSETSAS
ncbi:MAG TPA: type VI secretion system tube protein Hcp [Aridibacter sp.]|nr:type VI secretion system tube protein Hcp [Aridibacter sp.]